MFLSDTLAQFEGKPGIQIRKQCGIPLDEDTICPLEAIGEVQIPLDDGMLMDMPICEGHLEDLARMRRDLTMSN